MENKNKDNEGLKEILENEIMNKLDPHNEIIAGAEEKLITEKNNDGIVAESGSVSEIGSRINQKNVKLSADRPIIQPTGSENYTEAPSKDAESSYGSYSDGLNVAGGSKKKKLPILLIVGVLFFIAAAGAAVYILKPADVGTEKESPQDIIKSSLSAMRDLKSYGTSGSVNMQYSLSDERVGEMMYEIGVDVSGKTDISDSDNLNSEMNIKLNVGMKGDNGSEDYSVDLEGKSFGMQEAYYRINDFDLGVFGMIVGPQINQFKGKWYLFDMKEAKNLPGYDEKDVLAYENYNINKIADIVNKYEIFKFSQDLGDEKIGNSDVYHYKTKIDGMAVVYTYLDVVKEMIVSGATGEGVQEMEENLKKAKDEFENNYKDLVDEGFQSIESEVWIGKTDRLIYKMKFNGTLPEEYLKKVTDIMTSASEKKALDISVKSKVSRQVSEMEIYYDDNGTYENYIPSRYSGLKPENFRSNKEEYVIWSDMATTEDKWCVDSTGRSGYVLGAIDGYKCPELLTNEPIGADKQIDQLSGMPAKSEPKMNIKFSVDILYSDFNKPVTIEKPEGAINFFKEMSKGSLMPTLGGSGGSMDSDNDGLDDYMESYYSTDPKNPDTDGDGYKDGVEVDGGYDPARPGSARLEMSW